MHVRHDAFMRICGISNAKLSYERCVTIQTAQDWRNRTMVEHVCSKMGRTAARRNAPKQPRVIRAGPNEGAKKLGPQYREFIWLFPHTGSFGGFFRLTGGLSDFLPNTGGLQDFLLNTAGLSDPPLKIQEFIFDKPGVYQKRVYQWGWINRGIKNGGVKTPGLSKMNPRIFRGGSNKPPVLCKKSSKPPVLGRKSGKPPVSRPHFFFGRINPWNVDLPWQCAAASARWAWLPRAQYYVSQKQNRFNNKNQWYNILLTFIF